MRAVLYCLLLMLGWATPLFAQQFVTADHAGFVYTGRINKENPLAPTWTWPGIQIDCQFTGRGVSMKTKPNSGYFMVKIDNNPPFKVHSTVENQGIVVLADGLSAGTHRLSLTYCHEALMRKPIFYGLFLNNGESLGVAPKLSTRKIEFIGSSVTCALGNEWDGGKNYDVSMQNIYYGYAFMAARSLNARCQVVARSGLGIYRNTGGNVEGDKNVFPTYYPYVNLATSGKKWNFSNYQADLVCVNLGTNDTTLPSWNDKKLEAAFTDFLTSLRMYYPKAKILVLTDPMLHKKRLEAVRNAIGAAIAIRKSEGDKKVYRFDFTPDDGKNGYGYGLHPSKEKHAQMSKELVPYIRKIMGWN